MKNKILIGITILSCVAFSGCNESFLDTTAYGTMDYGTWMNTEGAGSKMIASCYTPMLERFAYQQFKFEFYDCITDDDHKGGSDAADKTRITEIARGNPPATTQLLSLAWNHLYKTAISNCNNFLANVTLDTQVIEDGGSLASEATKARWIAEARFLRAFYYFDLVKIFQNVPIIDKPLNVVDKDKIVKSPMADVIQFIYDDIAAAIAEPNLPSAKSLPVSEMGRVTKECAYAFRARVEMFNHDYAQARDDCKYVMDSGAYELVPNYEDLFNSKEKGYFGKKCIFMTYNSYNPPYSSGSAALRFFVGRNTLGGYGGEVPTFDLLNEYEDRDPRKVHTILADGDSFMRTDGTVVTHNYTGYDNYTGLQSRKHWVDYSRQLVQGNYERTDWSYYHIRYADVLLMYAEALIELNQNLQEAADVINQVRYRAFVTTSPIDDYAVNRKFNITNPVTAAEFEANYKVKASDDLRKAVRHERRVEFAEEGQRFYDLERWGTFVDVIRAFSKTDEGIYSAKGDNISDKTLPYPIPQDEIDAVGGSLVQNENYL